MRLLFLGSRSTQSVATLSSLLENGVTPCRILVHDRLPSGVQRRLSIPITGDGRNADPHAMGATRGIPTSSIERRQLGPTIVRERPDMVLVSCLPFRINDDLLDRIPLGWINIHPSPLPSYRGPSPIFWQLRDGTASIGVTLHRMTGELDRGPILDQAFIRPNDGATHSQIAALAGRQGGRMFVRLLSGSRTTLPRGKAQHSADIPWHPKPGHSDFKIDPSWGARHTFNFIKGVRELGTPLFSGPDGRTIPVDDAPRWSPLGRPIDEVSGGMPIGCYDGVVMLLPVNRDNES